MACFYEKEEFVVCKIVSVSAILTILIYLITHWAIYFESIEG